MIVDYAGFIGGTYHGKSRRIGVELCQNLIPEVTGGPAVKPKSQIGYYPTPGTRTFASAGNGPIRDLFYEDGRCFCVSGTEAYSISASGGSTKLGDVATSQLPAKIAGNGPQGHQIMFTSGGFGYVWNWATSTWSLITDPAFPANVQSCDFSDGYFLALPYNGIDVFYSALFNGLSWAALRIFSKTQSSDAIRNMAVVNKLIYLLGSKRTEIWQNTGDALVTFAPISGVLMEHGINPFAGLAKVGNTLAWVGQDGDGKCVPWTDVNFTPVKFSHFGIDQQFQSYQRTDDAICFTYQTRGHLLWVVTFLTEQKTFVADMNTRPPIWHQWAYLNPATGVQEAALARCHAYGFDKHLVGSRLDGTIYELTHDVPYDMDTKPIRRRRRAPHVFAQQGPTTVNRLRLQCDPGVANTTGQGSHPAVMMSYSVDGGMTYSDELLADQGEQGQYATQVEWHGLGQGDDWVFDLATAEPMDHAWSGASLDAEGDLP